MLKTSKMLKNNHVLVRVKAIITMGITALLTTCQPSYAIASHYKLLKIHSFNCVDMVAVTSNNVLLSQKLSVSPLRHSGIFLPIVLQDGSAMPLCRVDTSKYKTLLGKYEGRLLTAESETRHPNASQALAAFLNQS